MLQIMVGLMKPRNARSGRRIVGGGASCETAQSSIIRMLFLALTSGSYCVTRASKPGADPRWSDPEQAMRQVSANDVHRFFNWCLGKLERGEDGRKLKGIHTEGALQADWKYFSIHYKKITKNSNSEEMSEKIHRVCSYDTLYV